MSGADDETVAPAIEIQVGERFDRYAAGDPLRRAIRRRAVPRSSGSALRAREQIERLPRLALYRSVQAPPPTGEEAPPPIEATTHWIRIKVVQEDGTPVQGVSLDVETPGRAAQSRATEADGAIEIRGIEPGTCDARSPLRRAQLRDTWAIVEGGSGGEAPAAEARSPDVSSRRRHIARIEARKVRAGDTLESIASEGGLTWQQLAEFNWGTSSPREINKYLRTQVGCRKKTRDGKNYLFDDADDPGIIFVPQAWSAEGLATDREHSFHVRPPFVFTPVEIQTVDEFGHRVADVKLTLVSLDGWPDVELRTDGKGYVRKKRVLAGRYRVLLEDGTPAYSEVPASKTAAGADSELVEAVIDTVNHQASITSVVVLRDASEEARGERRRLRKTYQRKTGETTVAPRGEETEGLTRRSYFNSIDNLALAAGWTFGAGNEAEVDLKGLVADVLPGFLADYHPTAIARGFYVVAVEPSTRRVLLLDQGGAIRGRFTLNRDLRGLVGAYAVFEHLGTNLYVDMTTLSEHIGLVPDAPEPEFKIVDLSDAIVEREELVRLRNEQAGKVAILYYTPTAGQLYLIALQGGSGRLEDYGRDAKTNESIHQRNLEVCRNIDFAYGAYLNTYIDKVKKTKDEDELRALGPPRSPYEMPMPAGATLEQKREILETYASDEIRPWHAIAEQLDDFNDRKSQGYPFIRIKPKFKADPKTINKIKNKLRPSMPDLPERVPAEVELEIQLDLVPRDVDDVQVLVKGDALVRFNLKPEEIIKKKTGRDVPIEASYKKSLGNPDKHVVTVKLGPFEIEKDTLGKSKLTLQVEPGVYVNSEANARTGEFGGGLTFKFKEIAKLLRSKAAAEGIPAEKASRWSRWAGYLESFELQIMIGFTGTREETILAIVSNAPGFFERRSLKSLLDPEIQWNDLTLDEQANLATLGWTMDVWDGKYDHHFRDQLPDSLSKSVLDLTPAERVAIIHLGFATYDEYRKRFTKNVSQFADYAF